MNDDSGWINVAIVGGGLSGMAAAYELAKGVAGKRKVRIHIYERNLRTGGNIDSQVVELGVKAGAVSEPVRRWVDMGVNDINLSSYHNIARVMAETGYYGKCSEDSSAEAASENLKALEDSVCFFSEQEQLCYTMDGGLRAGVSDQNRDLDRAKNGKYKCLMAIVDKAALKQVYRRCDPKPATPEYDLTTTVSQFFDRVLAKNAKVLQEVSNDSLCNPDSGQCDYSAYWAADDIEDTMACLRLLRDCVYYPRISAMYFANDAGPEQMLLAAPYRYYRFQEGVGGDSVPPDRRYFTQGASHWFYHLASYISGDLPKKINQEAVDGQPVLEIEFLRRAVALKVVESGFLVGHEGEDERDCEPSDEKDSAGKNGASKAAVSEILYDYCIMATHADAAQRALVFEQGAVLTESLAGKSESQVRKWLASISYTTSVAVAHTYTRLLPPDVNAWRTYNVAIRQGAGLKPYSMTYVCNRHQNDVSGDQWNSAGAPQVFVTLNPMTRIPDQYVLKKRDLLMVGNDGQALGDSQVVEYFKHNLLDSACFHTQQEIKKYHESLPRLFFTGGWSLGAGLHEECWLQGQSIARSICAKLKLS
ncbi:NAD(P)-binding protein [Simiduia aestuariiviva]|uniref:Putative NAD/FAD-binding protein n=1 Tax=Simiduia aestuariiviva TaxID=1510459 RepID=A0A839USY5_9GAMM|nr:NAD(P)/FAD-dependent oxidoreductase [Simiduia aestuariiviva]MBB3169529.1 putative NAD/FAD-binding protein [Simiduia aestuariiviva]